jgi:hypothetical protein
MARTACTEPQCLYKGALYLHLFTLIYFVKFVIFFNSLQYQIKVQILRCIKHFSNYTNEMYNIYSLHIFNVWLLHISALCAPSSSRKYVLLASNHLLSRSSSFFDYRMQFCRGGLKDTSRRRPAVLSKGHISSP